MLYDSKSATSVSGYSTLLGTITLPAGKWIVDAMEWWQNNSTGSRYLYIRKGTAYDAEVLTAQSNPAPSPSTPFISCATSIEVTTSQVITMWGVQISGTDLLTGGSLKAIRIK